MVPTRVLQYLLNNGVEFRCISHRAAMGAQKLAAALHHTGHRVAKSVVVMDNAGALSIAVLSAAATADLQKLAELFAVRWLRLADEWEFSSRFPDCEVGAEPPFGRLYGLKTAIDIDLVKSQRFVLRAGSRTAAVEMKCADFLALEKPRVGAFAWAARARDNFELRF
jgi:Ala-tRNA(Pro) deacylase